jgi:hypothetical protein
MGASVASGGPEIGITMSPWCEIEAAAVAQPYHCLGGCLVGNAQTWGKVGEVMLHAPLKVDVAKTRHIDWSSVDVYPISRKDRPHPWIVPMAGSLSTQHLATAPCSARSCFH